MVDTVNPGGHRSPDVPANKAETEHLRDRILAASVELVATEGIAKLSMREVARRAGVSHQAPYHHFKDREAILAGVAEEGFAALSEALEGAAGPDPIAALTEGGRAYVRFAIEHPAHFRVMFRPELVRLEDHPSAHEVADRAYAGLEALVARAVDAGALPAERAPGVVTLSWSFVHGLASLLLDGPLAEKVCEDGVVEAHVEQAFETFEALLRGA